MTKKGSLILNHEQIRQKIRRIAYEIYENNFKEKGLLLAGVLDKGYRLATLIAEELEQISAIKTTLIKIELDKFAPTQGEIKLDCEEKILKNRCIIIVDDVLNTGRTIAYSLKPFLNTPVKKIETAVLVNRSHGQFPIASEYTGYQLSTTINEHIEVDLQSNNMSVSLH